MTKKTVGGIGGLIMKLAQSPNPSSSLLFTTPPTTPLLSSPLFLLLPPPLPPFSLSLPTPSPIYYNWTLRDTKVKSNFSNFSCSRGIHGIGASGREGVGLRGTSFMRHMRRQRDRWDQKGHQEGVTRRGSVQGVSRRK